MKSCKFCSTHVEDSVTHCPSCGSNTFRYLCENCGTAFDSAYCPNCGIKAGQKKKVCPECHSIYFTPACPHCGYTEIRQPVIQQTVVHERVYVEPSDEDDENEQSQAKEKGTGCGCLVFILAFVILGMVAFNVMSATPKKVTHT